MEVTQRILTLLAAVAMAGSALAQTPPPPPPTPPPASIVDLHGPDGLPFSGDDPLRVKCAAHRGVFFLSYNSVGAFRVHANIPPINPAPPAAPERTELGFIDLTNNTVSRLGIHPLSKTWDNPMPIGRQDPAPGFEEGADLLVSGSGLRHEIMGGDMLRAQNKDAEAAVKLDPSWIRLNPGETAGCPGGVMAQLMQVMTDLGIDYITLERFSMDKGQVISATRVPSNFATKPNEFSNVLAASFRVRIGEVWSKLKGGLGGLIVGILASTIGKLFNLEVTGGYVRMPINDITTLDRVPPGLAEGLTQQIAASPGLNGKVTAEKVLLAAMDKSSPGCAALGITDPSVCESELKPLIDSTRTTLRALVEGPKTIQGLLDCVAKYVPGNPPQYGWKEWKDLQKTKLSGIIDRVVKIPLRDEMEKLLVSPVPDAGVAALPEDRGRPNQSGASFFQSAYFYGPKGKWLIARNAGAEPGLVEQYVYARLNMINPYDIDDGKPGEQKIVWRQLDLITQKVRGPQPPKLPWPPYTIKPGSAERDLASWGEGTCQIIGDEAANGTTPADTANPADPEQASTMAMCVNPNEKGNRLDISFTVRSALLSGQKKGDVLPWLRVPANPAETLPLPPTYQAAGQGARNFRVAVSNRSLGRRPLGFRYHWDFDGNAEIDSNYGNVVRKVRSTGQVAACFVVDPVTQKTGVGQEKVNP